MWNKLKKIWGSININEKDCTRKISSIFSLFQKDTILWWWECPWQVQWSREIRMVRLGLQQDCYPGLSYSYARFKPIIPSYHHVWLCPTSRHIKQSATRMLWNLVDWKKLGITHPFRQCWNQYKMKTALSLYLSSFDVFRKIKYSYLDDRWPWSASQ